MTGGSGDALVRFRLPGDLRDAQMADHFGRHRDAERHLSLPGPGTVLGARILGEFGDDPHHYADGKGRRNYAGTSPDSPAAIRQSPGRAGSLRPQPASR